MSYTRKMPCRKGTREGGGGGGRQHFDLPVPQFLPLVPPITCARR